MEIANNWNIIIGIASVFSLMLYWTKSTYFSPILKMEHNVKKKVNFDLMRKLKYYEKIIKKMGEEEFVESIADITYMKTIIRESKDSFNHRLVPYCLLITIFSIVFIVLYEFIQGTEYIFPAVILYIYFLLIFVWSIGQIFFQLKKNLDILSRYLEGESPSKIFN